MGNVEHAKEEVLDLSNEIGLGDIRESFAGSLGRQGKVESLADRQSSVMDVV